MFKYILGLGVLGFSTVALSAPFEVDPALAAKNLPEVNEKHIHTVGQSAIKSTLRKQHKEMISPRAEHKSKKAKKADKQIHDPHFVLKSVELTGAKTNPQKYQIILNALAKNKIGTKVSLAELVNIARQLEEQYQKEGHVFFQVIVPMQKFASTEASVKFEVIEVVTGHVVKYKQEVEAPIYVKEVLDNYGSELVRSRPLDTKLVERYSLLANDIPGFMMQSQFVSAHHSEDAINLTFRGEQDERVRGFVRHNNRGTSYIGRGLLTMGLSKPSVFTSDELTGSVAISLPRREQLIHGDLHYKMILGPTGTQLHLGATKTATKPGFTLSSFNYEGKSRHFNAKVRHPYVRSLDENVYFSAGGSWMDSDLEQRSISKKLYGDSVRNVFIAVDYDVIDDLNGINELNATLTKGLKVYGASKTREKRLDIIYLSRNQGRTSNLRLNGTYERTQSVSRAMSLVAGVTGQLANVSLLALDQFGFGGEGYGRGYDQSAIIGDSGFAAKAEWRYDIDFKLCTLPWVQTYVYYDVGKIYNHDRISQRSKASASSAGLGVRYQLKKYLDGGLELNKALTRALNVEGNKNPRIFYYFNINF